MTQKRTKDGSEGAIDAKQERFVLTLSAADIMELERIILDRDEAAALAFLRQRVHEPLEANARRGLVSGLGQRR